MKLGSSVELKAFMDTVKACRGDVWLVDSFDGSQFNLKSYMSRYIAIAELIHDQNERLELHCECNSDEGRFYDLCSRYPQML